MLDETKRLVGSSLFDTRLKPQRTGEHMTTETDISQPAFTRQLDAQQHVALGSLGILRLPPQDTRDQAAHLEADRPQRRFEQQVLLEAVTAAPLMHQLLLQRRQVKLYRKTQQRIEVGKWDGRDVRGGQSAQRRHIGRYRTMPADAAQIGIQIDFARHSPLRAGG